MGGVVALAPLTPNPPFSLASFVPTGSIAADTLQVGSGTAGQINIAGTFNLSGINTLDLRSGAAVVEAGGERSVARLTGAAASAALSGPNQIGTLSAISRPQPGSR